MDLDTIHHLFPGLNKLLDFQRQFLIVLEGIYEQPWHLQRWGSAFTSKVSPPSLLSTSIIPPPLPSILFPSFSSFSSPITIPPLAPILGPIAPSPLGPRLAPFTRSTLFTSRLSFAFVTSPFPPHPRTHETFALLTYSPFLCLFAARWVYGAVGGGIRCLRAILRKLHKRFRVASSGGTKPYGASSPSFAFFFPIQKKLHPPSRRPFTISHRYFARCGEHGRSPVPQNATHFLVLPSPFGIRHTKRPV